MKRASLVFLLCLLPLAPAWAQDCKPLQLVATMPLLPQGERGVELVPVKLNGVEKKLLLDTGGYTSQLSSKLVEELKLPLGGSLGALRGIRGRDTYGVATVADFEMGNLRAHNMGFNIMPDGTASDNLDGLIAIDLFLAYDLDLDFGHDKMNFVSGDHCDGKVVYWPADAQAVVPMRIVGGHYLMDVTLDGRHLVALLDTGATYSLMGQDTALQYYSLKPSSPDVTEAGKYDGIPTYRHKFANLSFNGLEMQTPTIEIMQSNLLEVRRSATGSRLSAKENVDYHYDMILGMDMLRHLHVYIATKERKIYITPK